MYRHFIFAFFSVLLTVAMSTTSCKHDPFFSELPDPADTTAPPDPGGGGGTSTGVACDPDTVYFQNDVLPLLVSRCSESGCHNETSAEEGIILTSYERVKSTVKNITSTDPDKNELLEVILETDPDDRMPPAPRAAMSAAEIQLIRTWIQQGTKNNGCNPNYGGCDSTAFSWTSFVQPLIKSKCQGCHSGPSPQGAVNLGTYAAVKVQALNGKLYGSVSKSTGFMPKGGARLDDCTLRRLKSWIDAGAPEN
ncbi:MAG: c-type cytochrome domain-containing protein [Saprospiraceae bacterium]|nr:c-type cytochrome domain-containing protein [Saprospiraceae bacterium]